MGEELEDERKKWKKYDGQEPEKGLINRILFEEKCRATPIHITEIAKDYLLLNASSKPGPLEGVDINQRKISPTCTILDFSLPGIGTYWGDFASITIQSLNDIEVYVTIRVNPPIPFVEDREKVYWAAVDYFQAFSLYLASIYGIKDGGIDLEILTVSEGGEVDDGDDVNENLEIGGIEELRRALLGKDSSLAQIAKGLNAMIDTKPLEEALKRQVEDIRNDSSVLGISMTGKYENPLEIPRIYPDYHSKPTYVVYNDYENKQGTGNGYPEIRPHPLKARREMVRDLKLKGEDSWDEITMKVRKKFPEVSKDTLKKDFEWLKHHGYWPN